jgi:hypothetical protein
MIDIFSHSTFVCVKTYTRRFVYARRNEIVIHKVNDFMNSLKKMFFYVISFSQKKTEILQAKFYLQTYRFLLLRE